MSTEIPLNVIYQRVDNQKHVEKQQDLEDSSASLNLSSIVSVEEPTPKRKSACYKVATCLGVFVTILAVIWIVLCVSLSFRLYANLNQCFHSKHYDNHTAIIKDNIDSINFQVVTGKVRVRFADIPYIKVIALNKYRHESLIDKKSTLYNIHTTGNTLNIFYESPAFDFHACQHAAIKVVIPKKLRNISLTGLIKTGYLSIDGDSMGFVGDVNVAVEFGKVKVGKISANSISIKSDLAVVKVHDTLVKGAMKLYTHTGCIRTYDVVSKEFEAIAQYGVSNHHQIISESVNVNTKWGYNRIFSVDNLSKQDLNVTVVTNYGKNVLVLENPKVEFNLANKRGHMEVDYEDEEYTCRVDSKSPGLFMKGSCKNLKLKDASKGKVVHVNINAEYGSSYVLVDSITQD